MINMKKDLPHKPIEEQFPLPSNSTYRADVSTLKSGDLEKAQVEKENL